ncbi:MAG: protein translocase subunit SecF [Actinobacteria bacterium]|nr:protein translocase subunit SecF [Actinomycetota bacterium]NBY15520.1 protein translocase subunit SecF [Actinomycetota bacterium]
MSKLGDLGNRLYRGEVSYDFVGRRRVWYIVSAVFLTLSIGTLSVAGLNLGIEFKGGAQYTVQVPNAATSDVTTARKAVEDAGSVAASVTIVGQDKLRVQTPSLTSEESTKVTNSLAAAFKTEQSKVTSQMVGPTWGAEVSKNAARALVVFLILVALFLSFYFEWPMAIAALTALVHDVLITVGVYALVGFEVTPATVIGFLTILGYSLYDTVVVFDKVRENTSGILSGSRMTYREAANLALNQTLVRSINTSIVALLPVFSILFIGITQLGPGTLNDLALSLFVGMLVGTYSSIFIATPFLVQIKERNPAVQAQANRVESRRKNTGGESGPAVLVESTRGVVSGPRQQRVKRTRSSRSGK